MVPVRNIGLDLGPKCAQAQEFLEGSALRAGPQLPINVQLVRVRDDFPLWSGRYDQELSTS